MIERYSRPEMAHVWEDRNRYQVWLRVELAVCEQLARTKVIPPRDWVLLKRKCEKLLLEGGVDPKRVDRHEKVTRHDVIAFTTAVAERIGPIARYIHFGLTSSDVVDTSLSLLIQEAGATLLQDIDGLIRVLGNLARKYRTLPTIGRSHGIFAEPTSFGLKFLGWKQEWLRNRERLATAIEECRFGKLSGAVGVNAHWDPGFEEKVLKRLKLNREPVSTQVIPRDRHAQLLQTIALCGSGIERICIELRHLQRSEVAEVMEGFRKGQKGSSAMPHKRNPISTENLTGCARMLRAYSHAALENVALWHERDISHSSVERITLPDSTILFDYALNRLTRVLSELVVREDRVRANLESAGTTVYSGHLLLALVKAGASREQGYYWVQQCAHDALEGRGEFLDLVEAHPEIRKYLAAREVRSLGSIKHQLRNVAEIYRQAERSRAR